MILVTLAVKTKSGWRYESAYMDVQQAREFYAEQQRVINALAIRRAGKVCQCHKVGKERFGECCDWHLLRVGDRVIFSLRGPRKEIKKTGITTVLRG